MTSTPVLVLGAGFGGLACANELASHGIDATLIDQRNHHTFQPLLYQVATAGLDVDDICFTTRAIAAKKDSMNALQARVTSIDLDQRVVHTDRGPVGPWRALVIALGATTADYGVPGVADCAFGLKSAAEATAIRDHVIDSFETASKGSATPGAATSVVIVGGGPTGVEMAGGFAELFDRVLTKDFPEIDRTDMSVTLVEAGPRLLSSLHPKLGERARVRLERMGVRVELETTVDAVHADRVSLGDGREIDAATTIWAAGIRANPLADSLGAERTRGGRIVVDDHLRLPGHDDVYVVGDIAATRNPAPQVAPAAMQGGRHVAQQIAGSANAPFAYRDKGSMATIGRNAAVVELPRSIRFGGFAGWVSWLFLHLVMLIGFRNRLNVLVNWAWNYLTWDRGSRIVVDLDEPGLMAGATVEEAPTGAE